MEWLAVVRRVLQLPKCPKLRGPLDWGSEICRWFLQQPLVHEFRPSCRRRVGRHGCSLLRYQRPVLTRRKEVARHVSPLFPIRRDGHHCQ